MTTLSADGTALRAARLAYDKHKLITDELKATLDHLEAAFYERMESESVGSIKVGEVNFVRASTSYGQVQDRAEFVAWAQEEMPELLEHKERKALVNEIIRERLDSGEALPPGLGFYVKQYVSQRAA